MKPPLLTPHAIGILARHPDGRVELDRQRNRAIGPVFPGGRRDAVVGRASLGRADHCLSACMIQVPAIRSCRNWRSLSKTAQSTPMPNNRTLGQAAR